MKTSMLALIVSASLCLGCGAAGTTRGTLQVDKDVKAGVVHVHLKDMTVRPHKDASPYLTMTLSGTGDESKVAIKWTRKGGNWRYRDCKLVQVAADARAISVDTPRHSGEVEDTGVIEHITVHTDRAGLDALASAKKKVDLVVCRDDYKVKAPQQLEEFGRFRNKLRSVDSAAAPGS